MKINVTFKPDEIEKVWWHAYGLFVKMGGKHYEVRDVFGGGQQIARIRYVPGEIEGTWEETGELLSKEYPKYDILVSRFIDRRDAQSYSDSIRGYGGGYDDDSMAAECFNDAFGGWCS